MDEDFITVITHEGDRFQVSRRITQLSEFISCKLHLVACETTSQVDLGGVEVDSSSFQLVLNYCQLHDFQAIQPRSRQKEGNLRAFYDGADVDFVEAVDDDSLLKLCLAAKSMGMEALLQLLLRAISLSLAQKEKAELGEMLGIAIDVNERKEAFMKADSAWALYPTQEFS